MEIVIQIGCFSTELQGQLHFYQPIYNYHLDVKDFIVVLFLSCFGIDFHVVCSFEVYIRILYL